MHVRPVRSRVPFWFFLFALVGLVSGVGACKKKPCSGGGKHLNKEPLPKAWGIGTEVPKGNYQCGMDDAKDTGNYRHFEMWGKKPAEALKFWHELLVSKGYRMVGGDPNNKYLFKRRYVYQGPLAESKGAELRLTVSKKVKGKGWVSVSFSPPKK